MLGSIQPHTLTAKKQTMQHLYSIARGRMQMGVAIMLSLMFALISFSEALQFVSLETASWEKPKYFTGKLLGVSASVILHTDTNSAMVSLSGIPVGGTISGSARFGAEDDVDDIVVDEPLKSALSARFVKIVNVHHDSMSGVVGVTVSLPVFGERTIVLTQPPLPPLGTRTTLEGI